MENKKKRKRNRAEIIRCASVYTFCGIGAIFLAAGVVKEAKADNFRVVTESETEIEYRPYLETEEVLVEDLEAVYVSQPTERRYFNVPLSEELQDYIFEVCDQYNIAPALIISIIEQESNYDIDSIGDNGKSFGLMQIQKAYHTERIKELGVTDLLNPYQNIAVGIDYLAELKEENSDLYWVLMAYNGGREYANEHMRNEDISDYAVEIVQRASQLEREFESACE